VGYELNDFEWTAIKPMPPNKPRVGVRRVNDRRVPNGISWSCVQVKPSAPSRLITSQNAPMPTNLKTTTETYRFGTILKRASSHT
jgi:hypothetical protein